MKKLLKSEICESMNSARITVYGWKVNICGYCSLNSNRILQNVWKQKKKQKLNADADATSSESKRSLCLFLISCELS